MLHNILHFLKYHNAFSLMVTVLIVGSVSLAASPDLRTGIGEALLSVSEEVRSVDNRYLLDTDLSRFDLRMQVTDITEDPDTFFVAYAYTTLGIEDYVWQDTGKSGTLKVSKALLDTHQKDLGLYIADELGELIDYERSYLTEVQTKEKEKGATPKMATVTYAGLIGKFLSPEEKVFPGYLPVIPEPEAKVTETRMVSAMPDPALIRQLVQEEVARLLQEKQQPLASDSPAAAASAPEPLPAPPSAFSETASSTAVNTPTELTAPSANNESNTNVIITNNETAATATTTGETIAIQTSITSATTTETVEATETVSSVATATSTSP